MRERGGERRGGDRACRQVRPVHPSLCFFLALVLLSCPDFGYFTAQTKQAAHSNKADLAPIGLARHLATLSTMLQLSSILGVYYCVFCSDCIKKCIVIMAVLPLTEEEALVAILQQRCFAAAHHVVTQWYGYADQRVCRIAQSESDSVTYIPVEMSRWKLF